MAGPQDIQRFPKGLIDLLGMRATGDTPHQLAQQLLPVLDQLDYYLFDRLEVLIAPTSIAVPGIGNVTFVGTTVPQNQLWMLYDYSVILPTTAAASAIKATPGVFRGGNGATGFVALVDQLSAGALEGDCKGRHFERPVIVGPGQIFSLQCTTFTGAPAVTPTATLYFARVGL